MEQKVVRKLEKEIEDAIAEIVCRIALPAEAVPPLSRQTKSFKPYLSNL